MIVEHPQSSKMKFVGQYKKQYIGLDYHRNDQGNVIYYKTKTQALKAVRGMPCWQVAQIINPTGK